LTGVEIQLTWHVQTQAFTGETVQRAGWDYALEFTRDKFRPLLDRYATEYY